MAYYRHMFNKRPRYIALEGGDRVGKKTQSMMLCQRLERAGKVVSCIEVPFNDHTTHRLIYWMLERRWASVFPTVFQALQHVNKLKCQLLQFDSLVNNDFVILDRWRLSSIVYGVLTGANECVVEWMFRQLREPDVTIVLDGRKLIDECDDEYERNTWLQRAVRAYYRDFSIDIEPSTIVLCVDGMTREQVHDRIVDVLITHGMINRDEV